MNGRHILCACYILYLSLFFLSSLVNAEDLTGLSSPIGQTSTTDYEKYDKYGIAFEYPKDWKIKEEEGSASSGTVTLYKLGTSGSIIHTSTIQVLWSTSMANIDPMEFLDLLTKLYEQNQNITNVNVEDNSPLIVDGNEAAMKVERLEYNSGGINRNRHVAFTSSSSKRWIRIDHYTAPEVDDEAAFNHIVISFHDSQITKT